MSRRNKQSLRCFCFQTGSGVSKQTDSDTDTFLSHTAPPGELCDTGPWAAKGYTLMKLLRAGNGWDGEEATTNMLNALQLFVNS